MELVAAFCWICWYVGICKHDRLFAYKQSLVDYIASR
jgi:hypothetical protein